ncbi:hypothetical protein K503DRAFT_291326 [Rhizopogon vinicolor AM-OR11-026]|uniref:Uncharacterized protein n=1 Tax=Rhizopogon vinicolor AM-OR11-026 TaxID=1314800 RepID=A0A1B7MVC1_9AGAM|nr:hypothetical protein K503DRAFT_291326 [Rhizopogon vinicolor AM-OR11-026]
MSNQLEEIVTYLYWNNYTSVIILTLISYEYLLLLEKELLNGSFLSINLNQVLITMIGADQICLEKAVVVDDMPLHCCSIPWSRPCTALWHLGRAGVYACNTVRPKFVGQINAHWSWNGPLMQLL